MRLINYNIPFWRGQICFLEYRRNPGYNHENTVKWRGCRFSRTPSLAFNMIRSLTSREKQCIYGCQWPLRVSGLLLQLMVNERCTKLAVNLRLELANDNVQVIFLVTFETWTLHYESLINEAVPSTIVSLAIR